MHRAVVSGMIEREDGRIVTTDMTRRTVENIVLDGGGLQA
jgi:hypothetical protein